MHLKRAFTAILLGSLLLFCVGCKHDWLKAEEFADSVRCGMTETDIVVLATRLGVPDPRSVAHHPFPGHPLLTIKPRELDFIDILFEDGRAVAVQRGNYISFTTGMEFGPVRMLCGNEAPAERLLRDIERPRG